MKKLRFKKRPVAQKLLHANDYLFYLLYSFTFAASILESIKYKGFIEKHLFVNFNVFLIVTLISGVFSLFSRQKTGSILKGVHNFFYHGQLFVLPFLSLFWLLLEYLNFRNYPNYVFTKFHIIPDNLLTAIFLSAYLIVIEKIRKDKKADTTKNIKMLAVALFIILALLKNTKTPTVILAEMKQVINKPNAKYEEKMRHKWGRETYSYIALIVKLTPEDSAILIPRRDDPWAIEGNDHLMRGFLYPRTVMSYKKGVNISNFDFVLLSPGLSKDALKEGKTYLFPEFNIDSKKIYTFELKENKVKKVLNGNYKFTDHNVLGEFGLIEL